MKKRGHSMSKLRALTVVVGVAAGVLLAASGSWAQDTLTAKLHATGMALVTRGDDGLAMIELSAHGPAWKHVSQEVATADSSDLPNGAGKRFVGVLPIPDTDGGAIEYTETVTALPQGLQIEYDLTMSGVMRLNGLQVSVYLPVPRYGGQEVTISTPHGEPDITGFPATEEEGNFRGWQGQGAKVEVAKDTEDAVTIELRAATDILIQDLRAWDQPLFEIRFPAIMEDQGRAMSADDRFHLDFTVTFAAPVETQGP